MEPERIFKIGPFELWGTKRPQNDELHKAWIKLKADIFNALHIPGITKWINNKL